MSNRDMSGESQPTGTMRAVPVKLEIAASLGFQALLETGERKSLGRRIKSIRSSRKMTVRNIRPTVAVIPSFKKSLADQLFVPGVVIKSTTFA